MSTKLKTNWRLNNEECLNPLPTALGRVRVDKRVYYTSSQFTAKRDWEQDVFRNEHPTRRTKDQMQIATQLKTRGYAFLNPNTAAV